MNGSWDEADLPSSAAVLAASGPEPVSSAPRRSRHGTTPLGSRITRRPSSVLAGRVTEDINAGTSIASSVSNGASATPKLLTISTDPRQLPSAPSAHVHEAQCIATGEAPPLRVSRMHPCAEALLGVTPHPQRVPTSSSASGWQAPTPELPGQDERVRRGLGVVDSVGFGSRCFRPDNR